VAKRHIIAAFVLVAPACLTFLAPTTVAAPALGQIGYPELLGSSSSVRLPTVAANSEGEAVAVWLQRGPTYDAVFSAMFRPGAGWSSSTQIGPYTTAAPNNPRVAAGANGQFFVTWWTSTTNALWLANYSREFGWSPATTVPTGGQSVVEAAIGADALGNAFIAVKLYSGGTFNVSALRYTAGVGWGSPTLLDDQPTEPSRLDVAVDAGGNATIVWQQAVATYASIFASRYTVATGWVGPTPLESDPDHGHEDPRVAGSPAGRAIAVWDYFTGTGYRIASAAYEPGGGWANMSDVEGVTADTADIPSVAFTGADEAAAVWFYSEGAQEQVRGATWSPSGWATAVPISRAGADVAQNQVEVTGAAAGTAVSVWSQRIDGEAGMWASRFTPGQGWSSDALIDFGGAAIPQYPQVSVSPKGDAFAVWQGGSTAIYGVHLGEPYAPPLVLVEPLAGTVVEVASISVHGTSETGAMVTANGVVAPVSPSGLFSALVPLSPGTNLIVVTARDNHGNENTTSVVVTFDDPVGRLQAELAAARAELVAAEARVDLLGAQANATAAELAQAQALLTAVSADADATQAQLVEANARVAQLSLESNTTQAELADAVALLGAAQVDLDAAESRIAALEAAPTPSGEAGPDSMGLLALVVALVAAALAGLSLFAARARGNAGGKPPRSDQSPGDSPSGPPPPR